MDIDLLATKLRIPPPARHLVARHRLRDLIEQGVPDARLTVISAPAGYGKTTLLTEWARATALPVAWLAAGPQENDLERFLRCLLRAWGMVRPELLDRPAGILLGAAGPDIEAVLASLVHDAEGDERDLAIVIDDVHVITDPAIHHALDMLLDRLPPTIHMVLAGREIPPLSLARRRARNELLELRADDLRFDLAESRVFLHERMGLDLGDHDLASLHAQLEGWAAGLQLVGLTLRHHPETGVPAVVSGRHRHIVDYLSDDVFDHLPEPTQAFLLETSILDRLCAPLCASVTGNDQSQAMLESLEASNLFLVPLDDSRTWYRYHRLFTTYLADLRSLRHAIPEIRALHARAAAWYLEHDFPDEAFQHALDGDDIDKVAQVIDRYLHPMMFGGEFRIVARWIESLPDAWLASHPDLALAEAQTLLFRGQRAACARRLGDVEHLARAGRADAPQRALARATVIRCIMACHVNDLQGAELHARRALNDLPADDFEFRSHIYHALGESYRAHRRWHEARENYLTALDIVQDRSDAPIARLLVVHIYGALADLELRQGRMQHAAGYWSRAQAALEDESQWGHVWLPISGWVYLRIGELRYEWNDLAGARALVDKGLERATLGGDPQAIIAGNLVLARLDLADGRLAEAQAHLDSARSLLEGDSFPDWTGRLDRCQADLWIARGMAPSALAWCRSVMAAGTEDQSSPSELTRLAMASVLASQGDVASMAAAVSLLNTLILEARGRGETGVLIEALALRATVHDRRGDAAASLIDLEEALRMAEPEGYVRRFVDLGAPMARLLVRARDRAVLPDYVARLLAAFDDDLAPGPAAALIESLSTRELDVLRLMAAGLSNREIGEALFVSPETVKKHTGSIYGKLGVRGRMEAVARAHSLSLIE